MKQLREFMVNDAARLIAERGRCELCDATDIPLERIDSGEGACSECVEDFEPDLFVVPAFDLTYGHARVQSRHRIREAAEEARRSREEAERRSYGVVIPEEGFRAHLGLPANATNEQVVRAAATAECLPAHDVDFITVVDRPKGARWASIHIDVPYGTALKLRPVPDDGSCATGVVVERPDGGVLGYLREHVAMDISCIADHLVQGFGFTATVVGYQEYDRVEGVKIRIRPIRCLGDAERHSLEATKAFLSVVSPEELPPEIELDDTLIDFTKVVAFDLETWKLLPADANPRNHFPLGLSCCGAGRCDVTGEEVGVIDMNIWFARDGDDMSIQDRTGQFVASHVVDQPLEMTDNGYTIVPWNGCGFDFRVLAAESGRHHDGVRLAPTTST